MDQPHTMTVEEAAKLYGVGHNKMREMIAAGQIPGARKCGSTYTILRPHFHAFLNNEPVHDPMYTPPPTPDDTAEMLSAFADFLIERRKQKAS